MSVQSEYFQTLTVNQQNQLIKLAAKDFRSMVDIQTYKKLKQAGFVISMDTVITALQS